MRKRLILVLLVVLLICSNFASSCSKNDGEKVEDKIEFTVTFETDGGSLVSTQAIEYGEKVAQPTQPTKTGYEFVGWYSDIDLQIAFDFDTAITKGTTIYAKWQIIILTVNFVDSGSLISTQAIEYGEKVAQPIQPTKTGYEFVGWYSDIDLQVAFDFDTAINSDTTIYAKWQRLF